MFDGRAVDFIHVCHACYKVFDRTKEFSLHKDDCHPDNPKTGPHHTKNKNEYHCPKCETIIKVKHIAWFSKHLKFCRINNEIANNIVGPEDDLSENEAEVRKKVNKRSEYVDTVISYFKDSEERLRITGDAKGKNVQTLSNVLFGKIVDYIWGCKLCYTAFLSEEALESHKESEHKDSNPNDRGEFWNANTENYTCPHCKMVQNSRHLVWFIYHMKKCSMNTIPCVKSENHDTEDDSEGEDEVDRDPEQIVLKPYQIDSHRSEWICQSLLGRLVQTLYPCHICYQVFDSKDALRQHFKAEHKGLVNHISNGPYYNSETSSFTCPICQNEVCKNQSSSIKFIYHVKKCSGQAYKFKKACDECEEEFTQFKAFKSHVVLHDATKNFMCHLCTKHFPSNARLNYHVQYVHSTFKPYNCDKCDKSYKRKAELQEHEEMSHSINFNYSCEKCGKQFYGKKNLALHMKTHYTDDEKKHICNICGHRFAKIKFLKNHMTVHSDIRRFACEVCGARVKTRDTLKQHRKKLHNLLTPVPKNAQVSEELLRTLETPSVIMPDGVQQQQQHGVLVGISLDEAHQRHLVSTISTVNSIESLDHKIIGTSTILPKL